jgi:hypothetical protein
MPRSLADGRQRTLTRLQDADHLRWHEGICHCPGVRLSTVRLKRRISPVDIDHALPF